MAVTYVARPGDTLSSVLKHYGGSWLQKDWQARIMDLNPHIKDPDRIDINQLILVPERPDEVVLQWQVDYVSSVKSALNDNFLRREIERFARNGQEARRRHDFLSRIDKIKGLKGANVVYSDPYGPPIPIRKSGTGGVTMIIREVPALYKAYTDMDSILDEKFYRELTGMLLAAGAVILGVLAVWISGGTLLAVNIGNIAICASMAQAAIGGYRTYRIWNDGNTQFFDWLDSLEFYVYISLALDALSLAGVAASASSGIKLALALKRAAPAKSFFEILKGMTRYERRILARELAALDHPGKSNQALKEMVKNGIIAKRLKMAEITTRTTAQVVDLFGAGASAVGSGLGGILNKVGSSAVVLLAEEVPQ